MAQIDAEYQGFGVWCFVDKLRPRYARAVKRSIPAAFSRLFELPRAIPRRAALAERVLNPQIQAYI